jgi:hypothetical protein
MELFSVAFVFTSLTRLSLFDSRARAALGLLKLLRRARCVGEARLRLAVFDRCRFINFLFFFAV